MIRITIRSTLDIRKILGGGDLALSLREGTTLKEVLKELKDRCGEALAYQLFEPNSLRILSHISLMVNGRHIGFLDGLETVLYDGDEVLILPPVGGG